MYFFSKFPGNIRRFRRLCEQIQGQVSRQSKPLVIPPASPRTPRRPHYANSGGHHHNTNSVHPVGGLTSSSGCGKTTSHRRKNSGDISESSSCGSDVSDRLSSLAPPTPARHARGSGDRKGLLVSVWRKTQLRVRSSLNLQPRRNMKNGNMDELCLSSAS